MSNIPELKRTVKARYRLEGNVYEEADGRKVYFFPPRPYPLNAEAIERLNYGVIDEPERDIVARAIRPRVEDFLGEVDTTVEVNHHSGHREFALPERILAAAD